METGELAYGGLNNVKLFNVSMEGEEVVLLVRLPNKTEPSLVVVWKGCVPWL